MRYFCTYIDHRYLPRGLALYESLQKHCPAFTLFVLCMDEACLKVLLQLNLPNIHPIAIEDFEKNDAELLKARQNRSLVEYYFTCTPSLPLFVLRNYAEVDLITYLDSDLFFFGDVETVFEEIGESSIAIIPHRFSRRQQYRENSGIYNVGFLSFRRDENGLACLHWWRERCLEWCYDREEDGKYADQKYLDHWPSQFQDVVVLKHKGFNLAPWNVFNDEVRVQDHTILVDGQPLIFYHFSRLKHVLGWIYAPNVHAAPDEDRFVNKTIARYIYAPYIQALSKGIRQVAPVMPSIQQVTVHNGILQTQATKSAQPSRWRQILGRLQRALRIFRLIRGLYRREYIIVNDNC